MVRWTRMFGLLLLLIFLNVPVATRAQTPSANRPTVEVSLPMYSDISPPVRTLYGNDSSDQLEVPPVRTLPQASRTNSPINETDAVAQRIPAEPKIPAPIVSFDAINNIAGVLPPDTVGDVGPNHYVQMVNMHYAVYSKTGAVLQAPRPINSIWTGFGGLCETQNRGDPIVLYDQWANRWMLSQFAFTGSATSGPYVQCIAISTTGDPTGSYYRYGFQTSMTEMNDYPHFGIWPNAFFMTIHEFTNGSAWGGQAVVAFDRQKMLNGDPTAAMVRINLKSVNQNIGGMLPADADGTTQPPANLPGLFVEADATGELGTGSASAVNIWKFVVDWANPSAATFGVAGNPNFSLPIANFTRRTARIPQPGTTQGLDSLGDRLMHRVQYRNFGGYGAMVLNHTADVSGQAGIRWYEVRLDASGTPSMHQYGTFAPNDGVHRWMASIAMDRMGNIGLGYSASNGSSLFPSIWYTAHQNGDPLGTMNQGEGIIKVGAGSQTHSAGRWGDYSSLNVDPVDDCTFWYTTEYMPSTSSAGWQTRVGSFKLNSCTSGPSGAIKGQVTDAVTTLPIANANVTAVSGTLQLSTLTSTTGAYTLTAPVGTYNVTASKYGYAPQTVNNVVVTQNMTTTQNFALTPLPSIIVSGVVNDSGHGWPLYARIDITQPDSSVVTVFTNPQTGAYSVSLLANTTYTFKVTAVAPGYDVLTRSVTTGSTNQTENFTLTPSNTCTAQGYTTGGGLYEPFESGALPSGWSNIDNITTHTTPQAWLFNNPKNRTNLTGGAGKFAIADSDYYGSGQSQNMELRTPVLNFSGVTSVTLQFDTDYYDFSTTSEVADVDVSVNGGTTWQNVWTKSGASYRGPKHEVVNISAIAGNQASVQVRFHYYNASYSWWWQIDNVRIGNPVCNPLPGGLLVGNVYDANTNQGLNGATVQNTVAPTQTTTTYATPDDPNVDDGFYSLFSPQVGTQTFQAWKANYGMDTRIVNVVANSTVRQNFYLQAGKLDFNPDTVNVVMFANTTRTVPVSLTNSGNLSADFVLQEYAGRGINIPVGLPYFFRDRPAQLGTGGEFSDSAPASWVVERSGTIGRVTAGSLPNPWVVLTPPPTGVSRPAGVVVDGKFYMIGGESAGGVIEGKVQQFNPATGSWSVLATMATPVSNVCAAAIGSTIYVAGGSATSSVATLQTYDTTTDTWNTVTTDPLPTARMGAVCSTYNNKLYVFGGSPDGSTYTNSAVVYDPSATAGSRWISLANMPGSGAWGGAAVIGSKIYYAGMRNATADPKTVYAYDTVANTWATLPALQTGRGGAGVWSVGTRLYVGGGGWTTFLSSVEEYDTSLGTTGTWSYTNPLNVGRRTFASAVDPSNGLLYASSGWVGTYLQNAEATLVPSDVPWLSESPTSGTVPPMSSVPINVTFDSTGMAPGTYYARIAAVSSVPYATAPLTVSMTVIEAVYGVNLASSQAMTSTAGTTVNYTLTLTNTGNVTDTFNISLGSHNWTTTAPTTVGPLAPNASTTFTVQVTIPANATVGSMDSVTVTATSQHDPTKQAQAVLTTRVGKLLIYLPLVMRN